MYANVFTKTSRDRILAMVIGAGTIGIFLLLGMAVYKDIDEVMAAQNDLVKPLAKFMPRLVKMAPARFFPLQGIETHQLAKFEEIGHPAGPLQVAMVLPADQRGDPLEEAVEGGGVLELVVGEARFHVLLDLELLQVLGAVLVVLDELPPLWPLILDVADLSSRADAPIDTFGGQFCGELVVVHE